MPTYVYRCSDPECAHESEAYRPVDRRGDPYRCPVCGWEARRIISLTAPVQLSGGISVENITGVRGQRARSAREADRIADAHGQVVVERQEFLRMAGRRPKPRQASEVRAEFDQINRDL